MIQGKVWFSNLRNQIQRRQRARVLRKINRLRRHADPLGVIRQFLYLDSIALRSIYVSRYGPEDARTTITLSQTKGLEIAASSGITVPAIESASGRATDIGSKFISQRSRSDQVELVASEQSLFRDFLDRESAAGQLGQIWDGTPDANGNFPAAQKRFNRGDLIQVRIRLEADLLYRMSSFIAAMTDLSEDASQLQLPSTAEAMEIAGILRKLLINQAPIDAELVDWSLDPSTNVFRQRQCNDSAIRLVGLTQVDNYWVDVRRALFDGAECIALVRVSEDVPSTDWSPLKLFDAVKGLPGFDFLEDGIGQLRADIGEAPKFDRNVEVALTNALTEYLSRYAPEEAKFRAPLVEYIASNYASRLPSASAISEAFDDVEKLFKSSDEKIENDALAEARLDLLQKHALGVDGTNIAPAAENLSPEAQSPADAIIVGEIIALYW